jgi:hypothetical protein
MEEETINYLALFSQGLGQFFGVFLGVIAGTIVTIATQHWLSKRGESNQLKNFKFELELNAKKLESWLEELERYRNSVNGDSLQTYFGYFNLSTFVGVTAIQLSGSGAIYKHLSHELIGQLQEVYNELSLTGENYLNNQIQQRQQTLAALNEDGQQKMWQSWLKPQVVRDIDFWEEKFKSHLKTVKAVIDVVG